jgi:hypothetical protein
MTTASPPHPIPRGSRRGVLASMQTGVPAGPPRPVAASQEGPARPAMASHASLTRTETGVPAGPPLPVAASQEGPARPAMASHASLTRTETGVPAGPAPPGSRHRLMLQDAGCRAPIRMKS